MLLPARRSALVAAAIAVVAMVVLGVRFAGDPDPSSLDQRTLDFLHAHVPGGLLAWLRVPTEPVLLLAVLAVVALLALRAKRFDLAVLAILGPTIAVALSSFVLKHVFGRRYYGGYLAYPSGHTTALTSTILVVLVALALLGNRALTVSVAVLGMLALIAGVAGLVVLDYHYVTDAFGGICVAVATIALGSYVLDSDGNRRRHGDTHGDQQRRGVHSMQ